LTRIVTGLSRTLGDGIGYFLSLLEGTSLKRIKREKERLPEKLIPGSVSEARLDF
jgi:hypothetical protein